MLDEPVLDVANRGTGEKEGHDEEHADPDRQGDREHQSDGAAPDLDALAGGGHARRADQPAGADDQRLVEDDQAAHEGQPRRPGAVESRVEALGRPDDLPVRVAEGNGDGVTTAHQDALDQRLTAVVVLRHAESLNACRNAEGPSQLRTDRSRRFWKRSTCPAVSMIVCLPVKNG